MRFKLEIGPGLTWVADVSFFGHLVRLELMWGEHLDAGSSRYEIQYDETWVARPDSEKAEEAIRIAVADARSSPFDPTLITLIIGHDNPRWSGRIFGAPA